MRHIADLEKTGIKFEDLPKEYQDLAKIGYEYICKHSKQPHLSGLLKEKTKLKFFKCISDPIEFHKEHAGYPHVSFEFETNDCREIRFSGSDEMPCDCCSIWNGFVTAKDI